MNKKATCNELGCSIAYCLLDYNATCSALDYKVTYSVLD